MQDLGIAVLDDAGNLRPIEDLLRDIMARFRNPSPPFDVLPSLAGNRGYQLLFYEFPEWMPGIVRL
jgi:hypothetical protein